MTNYFSRLARTTGLHFGAAPAPRAAPERETTPAHTPLDAAAGEQPPHVEELRFVEAEPAPAPPSEPPPRDDPTPLNAPAQALAREESHAGARVLPHAEPSDFVDERLKSVERAADTRPPAFIEESRVELVSQEEHAPRPSVTRERASTQADAPPTHVETSLRQTRSVEESSPPARPVEPAAPEPAREDAGRERVEALEISEVVRLPDEPTAQAEPAASHAAQAEARRAYLREVVEWITGPADPVREFDGSSAVELESSGPAESKAGRPATVVLQRERAEASRELEVQDFSLSIGSISIVVEDAPQPAPAAAPAQRPQSDERRDPAPVETSRLRRHYIRGL